MFSLNSQPPSHLLCKRPWCYHSASKTHVRDGILKFSPIYASVIYQIPRIRLVQWILFPFWENSNIFSLQARKQLVAVKKTMKNREQKTFSYNYYVICHAILSKECLKSESKEIDVKFWKVVNHILFFRWRFMTVECDDIILRSCTF